MEEGMNGHGAVQKEMKEEEPKEANERSEEEPKEANERSDEEQKEANERSEEEPKEANKSSYHSLASDDGMADGNNTDVTPEEIELCEVKHLNDELMKALVEHASQRMEDILKHHRRKYSVALQMRNILEYPQSVLLAAIDLNDVDIVQLLLKYGADPNVGRHTDGNAVHLAALKGNVELLKVLNETGANLNLLGGIHQRHALHVAVYWKRMECVKYLIKEKACDANVRTRVSNTTPLHLAASNGDIEMVRYLLEHAAALVVDDRNYAPWMYALDGGYLDVVDLLLSCHGTDVVCELSRKSALHFACSVSSPRYANHLLRKAANCNVRDPKGVTPLIEAIMHRCINVVWFLLEQCPHLDVNTITEEGKTPLNYAIELDLRWRDKEPYLNLLKSKGSDPNVFQEPGMPLLFRYMQSIDVTRWLLYSGAKTDVVCPDGSTALYKAVTIATATWRPEIPSSLHLLLESNFDLKLSSIPGPRGRIPIQEAIISGNRSLVLFLVHVGCSLNNISEWLTISPEVEELRVNSAIFDDMCKWLFDVCRQPRSLAFLCRQPVLLFLGHFGVRDKIDLLPIPKELKNFLMYNTKYSTL